MKEFGSDFHRCNFDFRVDKSQLGLYGHTRFYACGRHAIEAIIKQEGWIRIWMPAYFCYEVIGYIKSTGIEVVFYNDFPLFDKDDEIVRSLPYKKGDVLFRTDYFGLRQWRSNKDICVPVIEDHTHGLLTDWAINSDADWCIASLRKSLPIAAGGILWSPKNKPLPNCLKPTNECIEMANERYVAMSLKTDYLRTNHITEENDTAAKRAFREKFVNTEEMIDTMLLSGIDDISKDITNSLNIKQWTELRFENWKKTVRLLDKRFVVLGGERKDDWQPFSLILLLDSIATRDALQQYLVKRKIYPAILWRMPDDSDFVEAKAFSQRMLSVHCDIRYNSDEITEMCNIINCFYDTNI